MLFHNYYERSAKRGAKFITSGTRSAERSSFLQPAQRGRVNITLPPLPYFLDSSKSDGRYRRETFSTLSVINLTSFAKISEKSVENFLRKSRFSDVMFCYFGSKSGKCMKASRMYSFEVKRNPKNVKRRKIQCSTKRLSQNFLYLSILTPKSQNFDFFKNKSL